MKWINVKDELPPFGQGVLITNGEIVTAAELGRPYRQGELNWNGHEFGGYEWEFDFDGKSITHWVALPEPYQEGGSLSEVAQQ